MGPRAGAVREAPSGSWGRGRSPGGRDWSRARERGGRSQGPGLGGGTALRRRGGAGTPAAVPPPSRTSCGTSARASPPERCPIPEGTIPQSEVAGGVTTNTIRAESISEEEVAPGQVAVTGQGGGGGRTATTFGPEAAMMTIRPIGGCTIGGTVAATGAMTTAGTEGRLTTTQTFGSPMNTIERTAVTEASAAAEGNTEGGGDGAGHSAAHLHTAAGEPRV